jgi:glycosyltransferase involved in cell wall biosynthesis
MGNLPLLHQLGLNAVLIARSVDPRVLRMSSPRSASIVIPARNEAGHIHPLLDRIPQFAPRQEIIFVEGNSTDDTWAQIQRAARDYSGPFTVKCLRQDGKGKGDAVRKGFAAATGDVLIILDADISVPPEELPGFYQALASGQGEFINGSRMVYLMDKRAMRFLNLLGNKVFGALFTYLLSQPFRDTLCGTKVLLRSDYERIAAGRTYFGDFDPFGDFDLLFGAARANLKIIDLPVHYKARTYGETNISRFRHGWMLLKMCILAARKLKFV